MVIEAHEFLRDGKNFFSGQAVLTVVVLMLFVSMLAFLGISLTAANETKISRRVLFSERSLFIAEAGVEDMSYRFARGKKTALFSVLAIGDAVATTTVAVLGANREIESRGSVSSHMRAVRSVMTTAPGTAFTYGVMVGDGGLVMENNSRVNGSVYSNGPITGNNLPRITGDGFAAALSSISGLTIDGNARANLLANNVIGGSATSSTAINGGSVGVHGYADTFSGGSVVGNAYYKTSVSATTTVNGVKIQIPLPPANLSTSSMPISDSQLDIWEGEAASGGTTTPQTCPFKPADGTSLGPTVITCDVEIDGTKIVTLTGALWVQGNFSMKNSAQLKLSPSFGNLSGMVIADNPANRLSSSMVSVENSAQILGSGQTGSYVMVVSRNRSAEDGGGNEAIDVKDSSSAAIYYAPRGKLVLQNNTTLKEAVAWLVHMKNSAELTYESGLADVRFSSGPTGGFQIDSWQEVE